jgi:hypothetical protein
MPALRTENAVPVKMVRDGITHAIEGKKVPPGAFKYTLCGKMYTGCEKKARKYGYATRYEGTPFFVTVVNGVPTCLWCVVKLR